MEDVIVKYADKNIFKELVSVGFDKAYLDEAEKKYSGEVYKVFKLKPHEANILKQLCLSLGFDCAVSRGTVMCACDYTDAIIFASLSQIINLIEKLKLQPFNLKRLALELQRIVESKLETLYIRNYVFDWSRPYIMGILNVTPDSFSDGGNYTNIDSALNHVNEMLKDGADIIDIGGESTRPDAENISPEEEISRIIPVLKAIRSNGIDIPISVDTRNYETAKAAIEAGADIINDVSGFDYDLKLFDFVCREDIPSIIVHSDSVPAKSNDYTTNDIVDEVYLSLYKKINKMYQAGLKPENIIADVGIGFGKSKKNCFELLRRHSEFSSLKVPMVLGISRKSFITNEFNLSCEDADVPTALYSAMAQGVNIHRVHNVKLAKEYLNYSQIFVS